MTHLVSIIIPAYNAERYLRDSARSALEQSWPNVEVLIVNDGSSDETERIARELQVADARVEVISKANGGVSSARNAGLSEAKGQYICFLDADDILLSDKIERQLSFLKTFPQCSLVYSDYYIGDSDLAPILFQSVSPPVMPMGEFLAYRAPFSPFSPLIRSEAVREAGEFDEIMDHSEDWDYWIRLCSIGKFGYLPGAVGVYRTHPNQAHHDRAAMRDGQRRVITKHFADGSRRHRIAISSMSWGQALHAWGRGEYGPFVVHVAKTIWLCRSLTLFRNVVRFANLG